MDTSQCRGCEGEAVTAGETDDPTMTCPQCGAEMPDPDGFGVLAHIKPAYPDGCGYCSHPSRDDGVCGLCGDVRPHPIVTFSEGSPYGTRFFASCDCGKVEGIDTADARRAMDGRCRQRPIQQHIDAMAAERVRRG
jgi:hypothetical protein